MIDISASLHTADTRLVNVHGTVQQIAGIGIIGVLVNANFEIVGRTRSHPTSDYSTQTSRWLSGLNNRMPL